MRDILSTFEAENLHLTAISTPHLWYTKLREDGELGQGWTRHINLSNEVWGWIDGEIKFSSPLKPRHRLHIKTSMATTGKGG
jgi:hypothetical protein